MLSSWPLFWAVTAADACKDRCCSRAFSGSQHERAGRFRASITSARATVVWGKWVCACKMDTKTTCVIRKRREVKKKVKKNVDHSVIAQCPWPDSEETARG